MFETADGEPIAVAFEPANPLDTPDGNVPALAPTSVRLEAGHVQEEGRRPLSQPLIWDQDLAVPLRDGVIIYADVFRPVDGVPAPTILVWTPYGKRGGWWKANVPLESVGVPRDGVLGLQNFESPDPAWWVAKGYAVVMVDVRGSMHSGGDRLWWGEEAGLDVHDAIEWAATQCWSSGRVGMSGNSQLAIMQWFAAATQPPHLAAIAPWEGLIDMYRDNIAKGGIPTPEFQRDVVATRDYGLNRAENPAMMIERYPLMNDYWRDKRVRLDCITVPAYVVASFSNTLHSRGTFDGFNGIASEHKWLRVHNRMEWPDLYQEDSQEDLCRFFDRYLKGWENGWEQTPRVRLSVLDPGGQDEVVRAETQWPPATMRTRTLYLDARARDLVDQAPEAASLVRSTSGDDPDAIFRLAVERETEIAGPIRLTLFVGAEGADDIDLFAQLYKTDASGKRLVHVAVPGPAGQKIAGLVAAGKVPGLLALAGPQGRLRVSHRELDEALSTNLAPVPSHRRRQPLSPGEIVRADIAIWPVAMRLHAGEILCIAVSHRPFDTFGLPGMPSEENIALPHHGRHVIYSGGDHASHVVLPLTQG